jgi:hypothetical protein
MAVDNMEQFEEQLAQKSRVVAFWSALGAFIVLSALVYSSVHLATVRTQTEEADATLKAKQSELDQAEARLNNIKAQLAKAEQTAQVYGLTLSAVSESPEKTTAAFRNAISQVPDATGITIQVAYKSQLPKAIEIAAQLRKLGYEVPPDQAIEVRGVHISDNNYLRYFFQSDETLANQIASRVTAMGVNVEPFSLVGAKDLGEVHPKNFELRLGRQDHTIRSDQK